MKSLKLLIYQCPLYILLIIVGCGDSEVVDDSPKLTDAEAVAQTKAGLTWDDIKGRTGFENPAENDVHFNLKLPTKGVDGAVITWSTTDGARIATDGTVVMNPNGSGTAAVTIEATISRGSESDTKQFNLTVREAPVLTDEQVMANDVLALVNTERANAGAGALTMDNLLVNAARRHSQDMASHGFANHEGSDASTFDERITDAGYTWTSCAENIAWNYTSAAAVVAAWMGSQGHKDNILNPAFQHMGISCFYSVHGYYWTQNFGKN